MAIGTLRVLDQLKGLLGSSGSSQVTCMNRAQSKKSSILDRRYEKETNLDWCLRIGRNNCVFISLFGVDGRVDLVNSW